MNKKLLLLLFAGVLMGALDIAIIGPALPALQHHFLLSDRDLPWLFNIYVLFTMMSTPLMGKLSDLYGRRIIYILDLSLFGLGSLLIMLSGNFTMLLAGRAIQGAGAGGIFPVAAALIGDTVPKEKQGRSLGWIGAVFGLAFILGPPLGGALLLLGWQWIFAINIPFALILIVFAFRIIPPLQKKKEILPFDFPGMLTLMLALACLAYGINHINPEHLLESLSSLHAGLPLLFAGILFPLFYRIQKRSLTPSWNLDLLQSKQLLFTYLIAFGAGLGELSAIYLPALAHKTFEVSEATASFMLLPLVATLFVFAPIAGRLVDKIQVKFVILSGILILTAGLTITGLTELTRISFYTGGAFIGAGLSFLLGAPLRYIMNRETSESDRASGQSILTLFTSIGQLLSAALMGALIFSWGGTVHSYQNAFLLLAVITALLITPALQLKEYKS